MESGIEVRASGDWLEALIKELEALGESIGRFTVPIIGTLAKRGQIAESEEKWLIGTGVLLELYDHFFVLSAGHCVAACEIGVHVSLGTSDAEIRDHDYCDNRTGQVRDWGYLEIDKTVAQKIMGSGKQFLDGNDLIVLSPADVKSLAQPVIIAGFPQALAEKNEDVHPQFLKLIGLPEGCGTEFSKNPNFQNGLNILITGRSTESDESLMETCKQSELSFRGMSGAGVWITGEGNSVHLTAIWGGCDGSNLEVCFGASVGSILKLISESPDSSSDLKKYIRDEWTILKEEDKWNYL